MSSFDYFYSTDSSPLDGSLGADVGDTSIQCINVVPTAYGVASPKVSSTRVCDRCIFKKVKCDLKRPNCSRCIEGGWPCVYSCAKRKPGPARGSRRKAGAIAGALDRQLTGLSADSFTPPGNLGGHQEFPLFRQESLPFRPDVPQFDDASATLRSFTGTPWPLVPTVPLGILADDTSCSFAPQLGLDQEREILNNFFTYIHPSVPLFRKEKFLQRYESGDLSRDLLLTIFVLSITVLGLPDPWSNNSLENSVRRLLEGKTIDKENTTNMPSLDNFHQACLLAFYGFHQYPGDESWMRIGQLTRKAYQCGLHQIDNSDQSPAFNHDSMDENELELWRYVWWFIYCLDSYSNITTSTPFLVESDSVKTALVTTSLFSSADSHSEATTAIFLPPETGLLWKTTKEIVNTRGGYSFNMHIITTSLLRDAATAHRLQIQNSSSRLQTRFMALKGDFSALRLALPTRYLNPGRNALFDESGLEHHARLISLLHLHATGVLLCLPLGYKTDEPEWLSGWQQSLEYCQDITSVIRQWDSQFFSSVDPAVCFIISAALILLHLHCCFNSSSELQMRLVAYKDVLVLFLEQFASVWSLPRFLIMSFQKYAQLVSAPLSQDDIDMSLRKFEGPLHRKWLNFLSLTSEFEDLNIPKDLTQDLSVLEWDFNT